MVINNQQVEEEEEDDVDDGVAGSGTVTKTTLDNATTTKITSMVSSITSQVGSPPSLHSKHEEIQNVPPG